MNTAAIPATSLRSVTRALVALIKPRITLMIMATTTAGMFLAPGSAPAWQLACALLGTFLAVGSANALNCWLERDLDAQMSRTRHRPLPAGLLGPSTALVFGLVVGAVAIPLLTLAVNPVTGLLGAVALISYVCVYTPLKQRSPSALLVGAVPGALPPLMGWTAVSGRIDAVGVSLFAISFAWQLPHFIAISVFRRRDYERAGFKVLPTVRGERVAMYHAIFWAFVSIPITLTPVWFGAGGPIYAAAAIVLGGIYLGAALRGLRESTDIRWARRLFVTSLYHLPVLLIVLILDSSF